MHVRVPLCVIFTHDMHSHRRIDWASPKRESELTRGNESEVSQHKIKGILLRKMMISTMIKISNNQVWKSLGRKVPSFVKMLLSQQGLLAKVSVQALGGLSCNHSSLETAEVSNHFGVFDTHPSKSAFKIHHSKFWKQKLDIFSSPSPVARWSPGGRRVAVPPARPKR